MKLIYLIALLAGMASEVSSADVAHSLAGNNSIEIKAQIKKVKTKYFRRLGKPVIYNAGYRCVNPYWSVNDFNSNGINEIVLSMPATTVFTSHTSPAEPFIFSIDKRGQLKDVTRKMFSGKIMSADLTGDISTADLNGDRLPDIFIPDGGIDTYSNGVPVGPWLGATPKIALSKGDTLVDVSDSFLSYPYLFAHSGAVSDLNNDGLADIFVGSISSGQNKPPYLMINGGGGSFVYNTDRLPENIIKGDSNWTILPDGGVLGSGNQFTGSLFTDINNDGYSDLILTASDSTPNSIAILNGSGSFNSSLQIRLPYGLYGPGRSINYKKTDGSFSSIQGPGTVSLNPRAMDVNNDGFQDLIIEQTYNDADRGVFYRGGRIQILVNKGGLRFDDETSMRGSPGFDSGVNYDSYHGTLSIFDINGDGFKDIIAVRVNTGSYESHVFINDGSGRFSRYIPPGLPREGFIIPVIGGKNSKTQVAVFNTINNKEVAWYETVAYTCDLKGQVYQSP